MEMINFSYRGFIRAYRRPQWRYVPQSGDFGGFWVWDDGTDNGYDPNNLPT